MKELDDLLQRYDDRPFFRHQQAWLKREVERLQAFIDAGAPPLLADHQSSLVRRALEATRAAVNGDFAWANDELWSPLEFLSELPAPRGMRDIAPHVAHTGGFVIVIRSDELWWLNLVTNRWQHRAASVGAFAAASADGRRALFKISADLAFASFDLVSGRCHETSDGFRHAHAASLVGNSLEIAHLRSGETCWIGGHDGDEPVDFATTSDGRFVWPRLGEEDPFLLDLELGHPVRCPELWVSDDRAMALGRRSDGSFALCHGNQLCVSDQMRTLPFDAQSVAFSPDARQLVGLVESRLVLLDVEDPAAELRWSELPQHE